MNKFFGVGQLLNHTVASVSATGSRLLGGGPVCNDVKTRTYCDTAAGTASTVSRNGHLVHPAAPPCLLNHQTKPILVVVDMDHTLIHGFIGAKQAKLVYLHTTGYQPSQIIRFRVNGQSCVVFKRPGVEKVILEMSKHYDLVLWTAGTQSYADPIVDWLDPEKVIFSKQVYHTERTQSQDRRFVKNFNKLQVALSRVLILDNSEKSYAFQPTNGVPISDFTASNSDTDLLCNTYVSILRDASKLQDVCERITDVFQNSVREASEFVSVRSILCIDIFIILQSLADDYTVLFLSFYFNQNQTNPLSLCSLYDAISIISKPVLLEIWHRSTFNASHYKVRLPFTANFA